MKVRDQPSFLNHMDWKLDFFHTRFSLLSVTLWWNVSRGDSSLNTNVLRMIHLCHVAPVVDGSSFILKWQICNLNSLEHYLEIMHASVEHFVGRQGWVKNALLKDNKAIMYTLLEMLGYKKHQLNVIKNYNWNWIADFLLINSVTVLWPSSLRPFSH